jgi:hypothetical protein
MANRFEFIACCSASASKASLELECLNCGGIAGRIVFFCRVFGVPRALTGSTSPFKPKVGRQDQKRSGSGVLNLGKHTYSSLFSCAWAGTRKQAVTWHI